jgi:hypothetical protein
MSSNPPSGPGIYLVTLSNTAPLSANADRPRIAERCIKVNLKNCKVGKAKNLAARKRGYARTFGVHLASFEVLAVIDCPEIVERNILDRLAPHRMRGTSGRLNEWLQGISPEQLRLTVADVLTNTASAELMKEEPAMRSNNKTPRRNTSSVKTSANIVEGCNPKETVRLLRSLRMLGFTDDHFSSVHHFARDTIENHVNYCLRTQQFRPGSNNAKVQMRLHHIANAIGASLQRLASDAVDAFP